MKNTGTCPKCQSHEIYTDAGLTKRGDRSSIPVTSWSTAFIDVYVCTACGFMEEYVTREDLKNDKKMTKFKEIWKKV